MNRRAFFRFIGAAIVVTAAPKTVLATAQAVSKITTKAIPLGFEYGESVLVSDYNEKTQLWAFTVLRQSARKALGRGIVISLRGAIPYDFGRGRALAWYTNDRIRLGPKTGYCKKPRYDSMAGYFDFGSIET